MDGHGQFEEISRAIAHDVMSESPLASWDDTLLTHAITRIASVRAYQRGQIRCKCKHGNGDDMHGLQFRGPCREWVGGWVG